MVGNDERGERRAEQEKRPCFCFFKGKENSFWFFVALRMNTREAQPQVKKMKEKSVDLSEEQRKRKRKALEKKEKKRVESVLFFRERKNRSEK